MPTAQSPTVCIVIPVHNGGESFRRCLLGVSELEPPPDGIIVVADGDTDRSGELAEAFREAGYEGFMLV